MVDTKPPIGNAEIKEVEARFGFTFPDDLREHYLRANGGRPVPNLFPKDDEYFAVNEFLPIKHGMRGALFEDTYSSLVQNNRLFPKNLIPIAVDAGGDFFCYSLLPGKLGAICFWQSDYYDDESRALVYLADSLEGFLSSLVSDEKA